LTSGVSLGTWERGKKPPDPMSCDLIGSIPVKYQQVMTQDASLDPDTEPGSMSEFSLINP